jgi:hypothetical protein
MLIKEFSIDPELFSNPDLIKGFIRDFGLDKGRVLSIVPKGWFRSALENLNRMVDGKSKKEAEILISTLQKWKIQGIAVRSPARKNKEYADPWLAHVEGFPDNPFDGVLTLHPSEHAISPEDIWQEPESWKVESCVTIPIEARQVIKYLDRAFTLSETIYIIDPYFNLEDSKYWAFWEALVAVMKKYAHLQKIIVLTANHKAKIQILGRNEAKLNAMRSCEIWQVDKEFIAGGFHDRFVLTDFVGFSLSNSLQEKPDEYMEIVRLTGKSYEQRKAQYIGCFDGYEKIYPEVS